MNTLHELALPAAIHRITMLERERAETDKKLISIYETIGQIRAELAFNGRLVKETTLDSPVVIPDDLRLTSIKGQRQRGNRQFHKVQKRWKLWEEQLKTGISINALAKFWGVHHTSIVNAQARKFKARKADPTKGIKPL